MDPQTYQQLMAAQLMGQGSAAPGTAGQNASTPYGAAFMTGNMSMPQQFTAQPAQQQQGGGQGMLGTSVQQMLQQPMAAYA